MNMTVLAAYMYTGGRAVNTEEFPSVKETHAEARVWPTLLRAHSMCKMDQFAGELPMKYKSLITVVTMSCFCVAGFWYQQKLIAKYVPQAEVDLHARVQEIHRADLACIAAGRSPK